MSLCEITSYQKEKKLGSFFQDFGLSGWSESKMVPKVPTDGPSYMYDKMRPKGMPPEDKCETVSKLRLGDLNILIYAI